MALITIDRSKYTKGASGAFNNQDTVAQALDGLTLDQVYNIGGAFIKGINEAEMRERYKLNNLGQQRMHIGNRLRKAVKAEDFNLSHFHGMCDEFRAVNAEEAAKEEKVKSDAADAARAAKEEKAAAKEADRIAKAAKETAAKEAAVEKKAKAKKSS